MEYIYFLTTIRKTLELGSRTVGWFRTKEEAEECLIKDYGDLDEGNYYIYAVVEKLQYGLYPIASERYWWGYDFASDKWSPIDVPEEMKEINYAAFASVG